MNGTTDKKEVALVTGASSGIGKAAVGELLDRGIVVYAGARRMEKMDDIKAKGARLVKLDVTDDELLSDVVATIEKEAGALTILVNNA